jgi:DNA-binding response OmpR family regulator
VSRHILLVDDEPQLLFSVREYLGRVGYDVTAVEGGTEGLEAMMASPPDLIISDIMMEAMDGFEFQRRVQALTDAGIPFIFLTAKGELRDRLDGLRGGADDYIVKPFEPEELEARVASLLNRVERTRQEERRELESLRGRIVAEISSQIRAPIANLTAHLNLLLSERFGDDAGTQARYLRHVAADADILQALAQSLADIAAKTDEEMPLHLEAIRVAPVVRTAAAGAARQAASRAIDLQIACGGLLSARIDGGALGKALSGLLEAAVEFSPPGSAVRIAAVRAHDGGVEFTITDGGCDTSGWEADLSEPTAASAALDVARRVVRAHGGEFATRLEDGRHTIVIWVPGRVAKHIGRRP